MNIEKCFHCKQSFNLGKALYCRLENEKDSNITVIARFIGNEPEWNIDYQHLKLWGDYNNNFKIPKECPYYLESLMKKESEK